MRWLLVIVTCLYAIAGNGQEVESIKSDSVKYDSIPKNKLDSVVSALDSIQQETAQWLDSTKFDFEPVDSARLDSIRLDSIRIEEEKQEIIREEKRKADSIRARTSYIPTGLRIGTDLVSLVRIPIPDGFVGWEVNADIDFNRYMLSGEFGEWKRTISSTTQNYANSGHYFRVGVDIAFFSKQRDKNIFFLGARYAHAFFDESLKYELEDNDFGRIETAVNNQSITATWAEITAGFRMKLWKGLWMGYTIRLKFTPTINDANRLQPYDIPGFGLASRNPNWGFNYQLFWRFGFRR